MRNCLQCGAEVYGKFCPECGAEFIDNKRSEEVQKVCTERDSQYNVESGAKNEPLIIAKNSDKPKMICNTIGEIFLLLSALVGLIFAFFCGVSLKGNEQLVETSFVYDYFGVEYKNLETIREIMLNAFNWSSLGGRREFALKFPAVLGTVFSAVGLLGTYTLFAITVYNAYRKYVQRIKANIILPAVATYFGFAMLAAVLLNMNAVDAGGLKAVLYLPTLVGLIIGAAFLGIGLILKAVANFDRNTLGFKNISFSVVIIALAAVTLAVATMPAYSLKITVKGFALSKNNTVIELETGLFTGTQSMLLLIGNSAEMYKMISYGMVGGFSVVALIAVTATLLFRKVTGLCNSKKNSNIILCVVAVILACVYLAMSVEFGGLAAKQYGVDISNSGVDVKILNIAPIVVSVATFLTLSTEALAKI